MKINVYYKNGKRVSIPQEKPWHMHDMDWRAEVRELAKNIKENPFWSRVHGLQFDLIRSVTITGDIL